MSGQPIEIAPGLRLGCTVQGRGPALLLMHGAEADRHMFDALLPHLEDAFTVVAYDQRECGETQSPPQPAGLRELAGDAHGLLRALGHSQCHVFGSSFGGRVAQMFAHLHPGCVRGLALGSTWALPERLDELNPLLAEIQTLRAALPESAPALAAYFLPEAFLQAHPQHLDLFRRAQPASERGRRRALAVADRPAVDPASLSSRCLVLAGTLDRVVPPSATLQLAQRLPHARSVLLEGLGHATVLQDPARVARELRHFLLEEIAP